MNHDGERGFTLVEATVAAALVAAAALAALYGVSAFGRFATNQAGPVRAAAILQAEQTLRMAQNAWKYGSPGTAPAGTSAVSVPIAIPGAAPTTAPMSVTTALANVTPSRADVSVTVTYRPDAFHTGDSGSVSVTGTAVVKAPPPGSTIRDPSAVPAPSGAP